VIVSSGIEYGKWTPNAEKFLEERNFDNKKLAVFISSYYAGEEDLFEYAQDNFLVKVLEKYPHIKPIKTAAFGGRIPKKELPKIADERLLGRIPEHQNDNRDWDKIETWAREVGKLFSED